MSTAGYEAATSHYSEAACIQEDGTSPGVYVAAIGATLLALGGLFAGVRATQAEGEFTAHERIAYGLTGDCEDNGGIRDETEPLGCNAVEPGTVALVNLPGLAPANTPQPAYTAQELEKKAVHVEGLLNSLQGTGTYEVTAMTAPASVSQEIRNETKTYQQGWECFAGNWKHRSLASWVLDEMPETESFNYVIAIGADSCPELVRNKEGDIVYNNDGTRKTSDVTGRAFLNTAPREIDVYTHHAGGKSKDGPDGRLSANNQDQTILHEVSHHNGLGHLGSIQCVNDRNRQIIDVYQAFSPDSLQKQGCQVNEYAHNRNIMGAPMDIYYGKTVGSWSPTL